MQKKGQWVSWALTFLCFLNSSELTLLFQTKRSCSPCSSRFSCIEQKQKRCEKKRTTLLNMQVSMTNESWLPKLSDLLETQKKQKAVWFFCQLSAKERISFLAQKVVTEVSGIWSRSEWHFKTQKLVSVGAVTQLSTDQLHKCLNFQKGRVRTDNRPCQHQMFERSEVSQMSSMFCLQQHSHGPEERVTKKKKTCMTKKQNSWVVSHGICFFALEAQRRLVSALSLSCHSWSTGTSELLVLVPKKTESQLRLNTHDWTFCMQPVGFADDGKKFSVRVFWLSRWSFDELKFEAFDLKDARIFILTETSSALMIVLPVWFSPTSVILSEICSSFSWNLLQQTRPAKGKKEKRQRSSFDKHLQILNCSTRRPTFQFVSHACQKNEKFLIQCPFVCMTQMIWHVQTNEMTCLRKPVDKNLEGNVSDSVFFFVCPLRRSSATDLIQSFPQVAILSWKMLHLPWKGRDKNGNQHEIWHPCEQFCSSKTSQKEQRHMCVKNSLWPSQSGGHKRWNNKGKRNSNDIPGACCSSWCKTFEAEGGSNSGWSGQLTFSHPNPRGVRGFWKQHRNRWKRSSIHEWRQLWPHMTAFMDFVQAQAQLRPPLKPKLVQQLTGAAQQREAFFECCVDLWCAFDLADHEKVKVSTRGAGLPWQSIQKMHGENAVKSFQFEPMKLMMRPSWQGRKPQDFSMCDNKLKHWSTQTKVSFAFWFGLTRCHSFEQTAKCLTHSHSKGTKSNWFCIQFLLWQTLTQHGNFCFESVGHWVKTQPPSVTCCSCGKLSTGATWMAWC